MVVLAGATSAYGQAPMPIPAALSGSNFDLTVQNGVTQFYPGINTPTYGVNGPVLGPTLILEKWDTVTLNVTNTLTGSGNSTTMHWHGMHLPAMYDGGPHQIIAQGATWSPTFRVLNPASTLWYHPHGDNKTDLHVSKGVAGMIIIRDSAEAALTLPRTYGTDDFPVVVQTKAFDILNQIAISTELDTAVMVNGAVRPYLDAPAQVIRLRLLNGSSTRSYLFGLTGNMNFVMIASDGGLLNAPLPLTRLRLSPGERAEILVDLQGMTGQTIDLMAYNSELPNGIHGGPTVTGMLGGTIPEYDLNPLNGADFEVLELRVVAQTPAAVTTVPTALVNDLAWTEYTVSREFLMRPDTVMSAMGQVMGPFNINGDHFDMDVINETVYLNDTEKWRVTNQTGIAHPFHKHDMYFYLLNVNGGPVPSDQQGKKDVVLVMPQQYVEFVSKFIDFADEEVPFMYHCHLLHHEDEGMMGSYRVLDTTATGTVEHERTNGQDLIYPNPVEDRLTIAPRGMGKMWIRVLNSTGALVMELETEGVTTMSVEKLPQGLYLVQVTDGTVTRTKRLIKR